MRATMYFLAYLSVLFAPTPALADDWVDWVLAMGSISGPNKVGKTPSTFSVSYLGLTSSPISTIEFVVLDADPWPNPDDWLKLIHDQVPRLTVAFSTITFELFCDNGRVISPAMIDGESPQTTGEGTAEIYVQHRLHGWPKGVKTPKKKVSCK